MEQHVKIAAILNIINGLLCLFGGLVIFTILFTIGFLTENDFVNLILRSVGVLMGLLLFVAGIPGIIGGFLLLSHKNSGRILTLISGFINLMNFPIGTALGVYTIWVLLHKDINTVIPEATSAPIN